LEFKKIYNQTEKILRDAGFAVVAGEFKSHNLFHLARYASQLQGEFAEIGTFAGGTARIIAKAVPEKTLYTFDSFEGITKIDLKHDRPHFQGSFNPPGLEEMARKILADCPNVKILKGWFPDTLYAQKLENQQYCFVHADADVYPSTIAICEIFFPRLVPGGIIVFDDYGYEDTVGARKAVDEYFSDKYEKPIIFTGGQAVVIRSDDFWLKEKGIANKF